MLTQVPARVLMICFTTGLWRAKQKVLHFMLAKPTLTMHSGRRTVTAACCTVRQVKRGPPTLRSFCLATLYPNVLTNVQDGAITLRMSNQCAAQNARKTLVKLARSPRNAFTVTS
jgi:hypothetical protein